MKACADCGPCLMKRILFQARLAETGREFDCVKQCMSRYSGLMEKDSCSAEIATDVHKLCYSLMGNSDPYLRMKIEADHVAQTYVPEAERFIDQSTDRFKAAVRVSIIGNIMDFGSGIAIDSPDEFGRMFQSLLSQGIGSDDSDKLEKLVRESGTVLYAFDNCGESQFDRLLIREIKAMGKRVVGVVRGEPVLNDVTYSDAVRIGLDRELDRIVSTGEFAIGFPRHVRDEGFQEELSKSGLLLTKGMANFESLSEFPVPVPVAFLLRAKCVPVASSLGVAVGTNVVRIKEPEIGCS